MPTTRSTKKLTALFQKKTVVDLPAIQQALGGVSIQTAFRYFKLIPYRRSYDHNGRYYTVYEASRFDREGLWSIKGIHFSVDGSLKHTVRRLVYEASAGATHKELQQKLQLRVQNTLLDLTFRDLKTHSSFDRKKGRFGLGPIRNELKALVLWILEDDGHSDAPFPFALPHFDFAKRCRHVDEKIEQWIRLPRKATETRAIECLQHLVKRFENVPRFSATIKELDARWTAFCELRDVLRLSKAELPRGDIRTMQTQLPALEMLRLQQIKQAVEQYTRDIEKHVAAKKKAAKRSKTAAGKRPHRYRAGDRRAPESRTPCTENDGSIQTAGSSITADRYQAHKMV
jgi:hypothetical protein